MRTRSSVGISKPAVDAIIRLIKAERIRYELTEPLNYLIDGKVPSLPVVSSRPPYKKPVWIPVVFNAT